MAEGPSGWIYHSTSLFCLRPFHFPCCRAAVRTPGRLAIALGTAVASAIAIAIVRAAPARALEVPLHRELRLAREEAWVYKRSQQCFFSCLVYCPCLCPPSATFSVLCHLLPLLVAPCPHQRPGATAPGPPA